MIREEVKRICKKHGLQTYKFETKLKNGYERHRCPICYAETKKKYRNSLRAKAVAYKGGKCEKCGYAKCNRALSFHHLDPKEKDFNLSAKEMQKSWETVEKELNKCVLLCANCHMEEHERLEIAD